MISGVRSDLGIKVFGDDLTQLLKSGGEIAAVLNGIEGAEGVKVEQVSGLPILSINADRSAMYRYGLNVADVQDVVAAATGGEEAGLIFEGDQRFSIVVRVAEGVRGDLRALERLPIPLPEGGYVPLREVASLTLAPGPNQISRENGKRRLVVSANVRGRDLGGFVAEVQGKVAQQVKLPPGYWLEYGGTFEQLQSASQRLSLLSPRHFGDDFCTADDDLWFGKRCGIGLQWRTAGADRWRYRLVVKRYSPLDHSRRWVYYLMRGFCTDGGHDGVGLSR